MTSESLWYRSLGVSEKQPACRRLSRLPGDIQWSAAIELAIRYAAGEAQYLPHRRSYCNERYWFAPTFQPPHRSETAVRSDWWMIPPRVHQRVFELIEAAERHLIANSRDGSCSNAEIARTLDRWLRSGKWQRIIGDSWMARELAYREKQLVLHLARLFAHRKKPPFKSRPMIHYTLSTGDTRVSPRSEVANSVIAQLLPLLIERFHQVPGPMPWRMKIDIAGGAMVATVDDGRVPLVTFGVAADDKAADELWPLLERTYLQIGDAKGFRSADLAAPRRPLKTPWCAAVPMFASPQDAMTLGDLERCYAWAFLELLEAKK